MQESILRSAVRSFFVALCAMGGLIFGLFLFMILIGAAFSTTASNSFTIDSVYTQEIVPNADGVRKELASDTPVVLKVNIDGVIGLENLTTEAMRQQLTESREGNLKNDRVKAVLLHINSPGGAVVDSDGIYRLIKEYKSQHKTPVYAFVDGLCASGGMYVACAADKIYSSDASVIGSVGVITGSFFNFTKLINNHGVESLTLTAGKGKDELNPFRTWKPDEAETIQNVINFFYQQFVDIVTSNRPIDKTKLIENYGAKVFTPVDAKEYGYINELGATYSSTLKQLLKEIGVEDENYMVVQLQKKTWYSDLFRSEIGLFKGKVTHQIQLTDLDPKLSNQLLYLYRPEMH